MQFYVHLTADPIGTRIVPVEGVNALHDTHVSSPRLVLDTMGALVRVL
jgi:hypothetical protein